MRTIKKTIASHIRRLRGYNMITESEIEWFRGLFRKARPQTGLELVKQRSTLQAAEAVLASRLRRLEIHEKSRKNQEKFG